ncbi:unnamed protein product [Lupinus luteus]|uniref:Expansin n=1 Tax=Lupinus luteus TaxID=3873 RepID=A0AAV1WH41_LUPLU
MGWDGDRGVKFELKGNPYWILVLVYNVANVGDISSVSIKDSIREEKDMVDVSISHSFVSNVGEAGASVDIMQNEFKVSEPVPCVILNSSKIVGLDGARTGDACMAKKVTV